MPAWMKNRQPSAELGSEIGEGKDSRRDERYRDNRVNDRPPYASRGDPRSVPPPMQGSYPPPGPADPPVGSRIGKWVVHLDPKTNIRYYWDPVTGASTWIRPRQPPPPPNPHRLRPLPPGWVEVMDETRGRHFYWNEATDQASWELP